MCLIVNSFIALLSAGMKISDIAVHSLKETFHRLWHDLWLSLNAAFLINSLSTNKNKIKERTKVTHNWAQTIDPWCKSLAL